MSEFTVIVVIVLLVLGGIAVGVGVVRALGRGTEALPPLTGDGNGHFELVGKPVVCQHCGRQEFRARRVLLNTWLMSLLRFDWLDSNATLLSCRHCGALYWFTQPVDERR